MKFNSKTLASFIASAAITGADEYDGSVRECVLELAKDLELNDLDLVVANEFQAIQTMSDEAFDDYLEATANRITTDAEKEAVLLICLDVLAADLVITIDEMANYFSFADILGVSEDKASEIFDAFVDEIDDLVIESDDEVLDV